MNKIVRNLAKPFIKPILRGVARVFQHAVTPDKYFIRVDADHMHPMDYLDLWQGKYEAAEIEILRKYFKQAHTIIEIGANIGYVARIAMEEKLAPGGHYVAIEPNPRAETPLKANLQNGRASDPSKLFTFLGIAVASPEKKEELGTFMMRPNLSSGLVAHTSSKNLDREVTANVPLTSLSDLMKYHAPRGASLICDAEGAEIDMVLKDPRGFDKIDQMSIELHDKKITGRNETPNDVLMGLQKIGFTVGAKISNTYYLSRALR